VRILVLHPGALGDIVLALPALALLGERTPGGEITVAGNRDVLEAVAFAHADRMLSLATLPLHRLYASDPTAEDLRFWRSYDRIVSWTGAGDSTFEATLRAIHADARIASWKPASGETRHVSQIFVDSLGLPDHPVARPQRIPIVPVEPQERAFVLHPGAGSAAKRWPAEHFRALAERLITRGAKLVVIEGPAEPGVAIAVAAGLPRECVELSVNAPLCAVAAMLAGCRAFVGNDSGVTHVAAAVGVPTVALFGPMPPEHWAPLGEHVRILRGSAGRPEEISMESVLEALDD
jgi:heptosyltransferase-3